MMIHNMKDWKEEHKRKYKKDNENFLFIYDGIVNEEIWKSNEPLKICFLLKESYAPQGKEEEVSLVKKLRDNEPWGMWKKVAIWTKAIYDAENDEIDFEKAKYCDKKEYIQKIAVVNIKKSNGNKISCRKDLEKFCEDDGDKLYEQLHSINPNVIVCGYTMSYFRTIIKNHGSEPLKDNHSCDTLFAFYEDKLIINYYHPASHTSNNINYYALAQIYTLAKKYKNKMNS